MRNHILVKDHLAYFAVDDVAIVWNRFYPSILTFRKNDWNKLLVLSEDGNNQKKLDKKLLLFLKKNNLVVDEDTEKKFVREMDEYLLKKEISLKESIEKKAPFPSIHIFNEKCNLQCSYCISEKTWGSVEKKQGRKQRNRERIKEHLFALLNQQYAAMKDYNKDRLVLSINGGEPLLFFDVWQEIIHFIRQVKLDKKTMIFLNTNGTLMTDEMAKFLCQQNVKISISIDCNQRHHDTTRVYANGKGTFADIVNNLKILERNGYPRAKISFQGTIEDFSLLEEQEINDLSQFGIKKIRVSPNLLTGENKNGAEIAGHYFKYVKGTAKNSVAIGDDIFNRIVNTINWGRKYMYMPYCYGLGGHEQGAILAYNFENESLSYVCHFAPLSHAKVNGNINIFNEDAVAKTLAFMRARSDKIKESCLDCAVVGLCVGGCVINGLTGFNEINQVACDFRKALWLLFVKEEYARKKNQGRSLVTAS